MANSVSEIDLTKFTDAESLRTVMVNARRLGREDVYWKAFGRLCALSGMSETDPLHREFAQTLTAYEELLSAKNGRRTVAARTRQKLANKGVEQSLEDWALSPNPTDGFKLLMEKGLEPLTGESLVVKYADRFSSGTVAAARARLAAYRTAK